MTHVSTPPAPGSRVDAESIYRVLLADIRRGDLPSGTPVREVALASRFGVSRTPVREALRRLQHDRLLEQSPRGLVVREVTADEVIQIYDVRMLLEGEVAAAAAAARLEADLLRLDALLERDRRLVDPDDARRAETNLEFHAMVWAASHNAVLEDLLGRLTLHLVHTPHSTLSVAGRWSEALDEHQELVDAIRSRDAARARRVAVRHMARAREIRLDLIRRAPIHD